MSRRRAAAADGEDVNFGVVDVDDKPYQQLADAIRQTTPRLNPLHAASADRPQSADTFRDDFAKKPTAQASPSWNAPITINGELSDWSDAFRINGIQPHADGRHRTQPGIACTQSLYGLAR